MDTHTDPIAAIAPDFTYVDTGRRFPQAPLVEPTTSGYLLVAAIETASRHGYRLRAHNVRRMGPVDHRREGVFPSNYFYADRTDLNLAAWQYTAGWFRDQTGLDNSTVLLPDATSEPRHRLVNHARWDRLRDVLLEHFRVNGVAAMPVLYRLAGPGSTFTTGRG